MENLVPTISLPANLSFNLNSTGNAVGGVSVDDAESDDLTIRLSVEGTMSLGVVTGLTFTTGDGTDDSYMVFSGTLADINAALASLTYTPLNGDLEDTLTLEASDGQHFESGPGNFPASIDLSALGGSDGFVINGINATDRSGTSVSDAGDVNGDGIADLIIGAYLADPNGTSSGQSYVVFGSTGAIGTSLELSDLDGTNGFSFNGNGPGDQSGISVSSAGDINGDGFDDVVVGAHLATGSADAGESYVIFGTSAGFSAAIEASDLDGSNGFTLHGVTNNDNSGYSVSSAGDVNGDGIDDLLISGHLADPLGDSGAGETYVVYGNTAGFSPDFELSDLDGSDGFTINGIDSQDRSGFSVADAGDVNGDGIGDLVIGAPLADRGSETNAGEVYVIFGTTAGFGSALNLGSLNGTNGFNFKGHLFGDQAGTSVSSAGDINGDGYDDIIIGAPDASTNGASSGTSYVIFGASGGFSQTSVLSSLNGTDGFAIYGVAANDQSGFSVASAGDVNNDGLDDLLISAKLADPNGNSAAGETYLLFGSSSAYSATFELSDIDGTNGFKIVGTTGNDQSGTSVSAAGDINGDGVDDLLVGAPNGDPLGGSDAGETYVIFGRADLTESFEQASVNISMQESPPSLVAPVSAEFAINSSGNLVTGLSVDDSDSATLSVRLVVDGSLNLGSITGLTFSEGDGTDDTRVAFSGTLANLNAALASLTYAPLTDATSDVLFFDVADETGTLAPVTPLSELDGTTGFVINGITAGDRSGASVADAGDVNGDGIDDVIIGAYTADPNGTSSGESYIVFGSSSGFASNLDLSSLDGTNGFAVSGVTTGDQSGISVAGAGDVNGDGIGDVIIGAHFASPGSTSDAGESYVIFGQSSGFVSNVEISDLDGTNGFVVAGISNSDNSGFSVDSAGDVNGDGVDDLVIGGYLGDPNGNSGAGETYIVFGQSSGFAATFELSAIDGSNGFTINGVNNQDRSGYSVASAGDVNGDGIDDLVIGGPLGERGSETNAGESYIVFGSSTGFSTQLDLSTLDGTTGVILRGDLAGDQSGWSVSSAGDINGDGLDDIVVGALFADQNGTDSGTSYVVYGTDQGYGSVLNLGEMNGNDGFAIYGISTNDESGVSVSSAGDVNADGIDDLIIGANLADPNGINNAGETYIVYGTTDGFSAGFELSDINGRNGFRVEGLDSNDQSGVSVSAAGDVNSDGIDDLIIGAQNGDPDGNTDAGESYVIFGSSNLAQNFESTSVSISLVEYPPEISAPGTAVFNKNSTDNSLSSLSVSDADSTTLTVRLSATGTMSLSVLTGLSFTQGDGTEDSELVFYGATDDLNAALASLTYSAPADATSDLITFEVSDDEAAPAGPLFPAALELSDLDGSNGFTVNGIFNQDRTGWAVSDAGDLNGDGIDDIIIGGQLTDAAYVILGTGDGFSPTIELSDLDGSNGFEIFSNVANGTGRAVSAAGDINGDGLDDLLVGAYSADPNGVSAAGETYVVYGRSAGFSTTLQVSDINGLNGFVINGTTAGDASGSAVSSAGDVNGDGIDDILIAAENASPNGNANSGTAYLVFGASSGFGTEFDLSDLDGSNGFAMNGELSDDTAAGMSVSSAGDLNDDGFDDIVVGLPAADQGGSLSIGKSYVIYGASTGFSAQLDFSDIDGTNGFEIIGAFMGDNSGVSVSNAGDVNGDGIDDLLIGANTATPDNGSTLPGAAYVLFGSTGGFAASTQLSDLDGSNGFKVNGIDHIDDTGNTVSGIGDVNGDGFDDILIGASLGDPNDVSSGESYVVFGTSSGFSAVLEASDLDGDNGFVINGVAGFDYSGTSVSGAGDINNDGISDLIIGAYGASPGDSTQIGQSYVVFGSEDIAQQFVSTQITVDLVPAFRDFDLSGTSDLLFQRPGNANYLRLYDPADAAPASNEGRPNSTSYGFADLDGDGTLDHILKGFNGAHVVQYGVENGTSENIGRGNSVISGFADIDGDGEAEAFAQSLNPNVTRLFLLDDGFLTITNLKVSDQLLKGFGDFDGDGVTDALIEATNGAKRIYSDADGMILYGKRNNDSVAIGDFDGDGDDDLLTTRGGGNPFYILEGDETSPFDNETSIGFGFHTAVAAGDFDGDGAKDILIQENATSEWSLLSDGLTTETALGFAAYEYEAIGDFNGDGEADILFRDGADAGQIFYSGLSGAAATVSDLVGQTVRDIADYDGDNIDDVLISDQVTGAFAILTSGTGAPIALDGALDGAGVVQANGIDTLGLINASDPVVNVEDTSVSGADADPLTSAFNRPDYDVTGNDEHMSWQNAQEYELV